MGDDLMTALRHFAAGDLVGWTGLPACGPADLSAAFGGVVEDPGTGRLSGAATKFRTYRVLGQRDEIWGWFDDDDRARALVLDEPAVAAPVPKLLDALGSPEHKLAPGVGHHADAFQWIWANRGLTLYVREWRDDGPDVARAVVYPPTTVDDYVDNLGATDRTRYD